MTKPPCTNCARMNTTCPDCQSPGSCAMCNRPVWIADGALVCAPDVCIHNTSRGSIACRDVLTRTLSSP